MIPKSVLRYLRYRKDYSIFSTFRRWRNYYTIKMHSWDLTRAYHKGTACRGRASLSFDVQEDYRIPNRLRNLNDSVGIGDNIKIRYIMKRNINDG